MILKLLVWSTMIILPLPDLRLRFTHSKLAFGGNSSLLIIWSRVFFNGCVHWIASDSHWSHYFIMTFDITTELFGEFQLPEFLAQKHFLMWLENVWLSFILPVLILTDWSQEVGIW